MSLGSWLKEKLGLTRRSKPIGQKRTTSSPVVAPKPSDEQIRETLRPLIAEMGATDPQVKYRAVLTIGRLVAKSEGVAPADAIFDQYYHTKWNKRLIGDGVAIAALGILARNGDEAALKILREFPIGGDNDTIFLQIKVIAATPDTGCFEKLVELMKAEHCWYKQRVADALEAQISSHGSSILSEALHRALRYINIESLRQAIIRELQKRGEPV